MYDNAETTYWKYLLGNFLNRVKRRCRKILPTLEERIQDMFDFAG